MEHRDTTRCRLDFFLHGSVDRAVLALDRSLRKAKGIFEFSDDEQCILRIAVIASEARILLPDGTELRPEEPVLQPPNPWWIKARRQLSQETWGPTR